ncbi:TM2 domain-containing protein [Mycoplasma sp. Ms02]|uniref:TM2 domain-containing protein n=1 Tax=Mycoplasma sp. Ms02 TaxID=353851 RepID=UPI001C894BAE|nr:TM2 domain-containing protein [Mycoplasma sp. Ms02]QZE12201.1 TM2 domain-containing protein [Mycoplasma sp. Ms02]
MENNLPFMCDCQTKSPKSRATLSIISFLLGGFGVNYFYVGRNLVGGIKLGLFILVSILGYILQFKIASLILDYSPENELNFIQIMAGFGVWFYIMILLVVVHTIWNLVDIIMAICGVVKDKDGKKVSSWDGQKFAFCMHSYPAPNHPYQQLQQPNNTQQE